MAGWLEAIGETGTDLIGVAGEVAGDRLRNEGKTRNPDRPKEQPEKQYDTTVQRPLSGQRDNRDQTISIEAQMREALADYKWYAAGGLALVAFMAWRGAK